MASGAHERGGEATVAKDGGGLWDVAVGLGEGVLRGRVGIEGPGVTGGPGVTRQIGLRRFLGWVLQMGVT